MPTDDLNRQDAAESPAGAATDEAAATENAAPPNEMAPAIVAPVRPRGRRLVTPVTGVVVAVALGAIALGLAFRSGAYIPKDWLPFVVGVALLAVVLALSGPRVRSTRTQKILLALFGVLVLWTAASLLWASSLSNTWEEVNRTLFYAVVIALIFVAVRWMGPAGTHVVAALVTGAVAIVALVLAISLGVSDTPERYFASARLNYPVSYFNGVAALLMIGFWLAMGLATGAGGARASAASRADAAVDAGRTAAGQTAAGRRSATLRRCAQPLLLALAVFLAELALLPQSRGAFWTFFLTAPFFVILSTNRFRALVHLVVVALPVVLFWSRLNGVYVALRDGGELRPALDTMLTAVGYSIMIVVGAWAVTYLVERLAGPLSRRLVMLIGAVLVVLALGGVVGGLVYADVRTGGLDEYVGARWDEMTSDGGGAGAGSGSRFTGLGLNGRWRMWTVAAHAFEDNPALGVGAQSYEVYYYQHRVDPIEVKQPHSLPMRMLSELGLPGFVLWATFVLATLIWAAVTRFRTPERGSQAVLAATLVAVISWLIHSSADWLWQLAGVSVPAMMLLGTLAAAGAPRHSAPTTATSAPRRRPDLTRPLLAMLALAIVVSAALPYLALRYCDLASVAPDLETMNARAGIAARLDPTSAQPFAVRANAYRAVAESAPEGSLERAGQLALVAAAWAEAVERDSGNWASFYRAAETALAARDAALAADAGAAEELERAARTYLDEVHRLNPQSEQARALEEAF